MKDLVYPAECYKIIGACFEVYKEKGCGFLESVFQECAWSWNSDSREWRSMRSEFCGLNTKVIR
ncbi:MAG: GxxExxY protein [Opitutaceae bacterium]